MFLNRLCWWTSLTSFAVFFTGCVALLGVFFVPIFEMTEWTLRILGPIVGCGVLASIAADLHVVEEADSDAAAVTMNAGNIASGALAVVLGTLLTVSCGIGSYFWMMNAMFA